MEDIAFELTKLQMGLTDGMPNLMSQSCVRTYTRQKEGDLRIIVISWGKSWQMIIETLRTFPENKSNVAYGLPKVSKNNINITNNKTTTITTANLTQTKPTVTPL